APPPHTGLLTVRARHAAGDVTPKPGLFRSLLGRGKADPLRPTEQRGLREVTGDGGSSHGWRVGILQGDGAQDESVPPAAFSTGGT
ncbi:hypothetical protein, partial [Nakamurella sp. UYEF19]|uniref:hypothetical protein n=1 Tax=Nakamurella sp. UYEF19 TaxID=1756392 RepID=UPI00339A7740